MLVGLCVDGEISDCDVSVSEVYLSGAGQRANSQLSIILRSLSSNSSKVLLRVETNVF